MIVLTSAQVCAFRLRRHHLARRGPPSSLPEVVGDVCGIQAQVFAAGQMGLWARVENLTQDDVKRALWEERTLVKTWCLRRTVHLLSAVDLPTYVNALERNSLREERRWLTRRGVPPDRSEAMIGAIVKALDGRRLTRTGLAAQVVTLLGTEARPWVEHSWGSVVRQACLRGLVCFGPNQGQKVTFVRQDQWLPAQEPVPVKDAETALARRYLRSYGPAAPQDFATWTGMRVNDAKLVWERLGSEVVTVSVEGDAKTLLREDVEAVQIEPDGDQLVCLLPSFDCYLLAHRDKGHLVDEKHYKRVYRKAGWLSPVVLVDGRIAGVWSHRRQGARLRLVVELFDRVTGAVRDRIEAELADLGRFLGATCTVSYV